MVVFDAFYSDILQIVVKRGYKKMSKRISITLTDEDHKLLEQVAEEEKRTLASTARWILETFLEERAKKEKQ